MAYQAESVEVVQRERDLMNVSNIKFNFFAYIIL